MAALSLDVELAPHGMSPAQEAVVSWGTSTLLHFGLALLLLAAVYLVGKQAPKQEEGRVIPVAVASDLDTPFRRDQKPLETTRRPAQDLFDPKNLPGIDPNGSIDSAFRSVSASTKGEFPLDFISSGTRVGDPNGRVGVNTLGGPAGRLAPYGPRSVGLFDPPVSAARMPHKIVFVLDHSGSMIDTFDFLREEVKRVVRRFGPLQQFSVVMFSETVQVLGPESLQRAQNQSKTDLFNRLDQIRAGGRNDDLLDPFSKAFAKAFAMHPEVIVFLTDGRFDTTLPKVVAGMNKDKAVKINTIAFVKIDRQSEVQLREIAAENAGNYRFVSHDDLGIPR